MAITTFETFNSVFNITVERNKFSITTAEQWIPEGGKEPINKLTELLEPKSEKENELHVKEVRRRVTRIELKKSGCILAGFDHFKSEILAELRRVKYQDPQHMVQRMKSTNDEIVDILDVTYNAG